MGKVGDFGDGVTPCAADGLRDVDQALREESAGSLTLQARDGIAVEVLIS